MSKSAVLEDRLERALSASGNSREIATGGVGGTMTKPKPGAVRGRPQEVGDATRTLGVRLSIQEHQDLRTVAFLRGTTASEIVREMVSQFLQKNPAPKLPKA